MQAKKAVNELRIFARALVRELGVVDSASNPNDIALSHCHILVELSHELNLTSKDLASRLIVDKAAISRAVAQLSDLGYIALGDDPTDKRCRPIVLTSAGKRKLEQINRSANARISKAVTLLSKSERQKVLVGLSLYVSALTRARSEKLLNSSS